ncbi:MAG: aminotransferase class I/II-fold pyridoxal phosphate-dependent enzyme, partial [Pseudomonadota bacterium]|nr:aminotransferase class I/II-fold pyridoxal phosphate-dependent enzyme [Pseudomonadota bacterium]
MPVPKPLPGLSALKPYIAGESDITGRDNIIKLASNEGAFGPSPRTIEALNQSYAEFHRYPDGDSLELRELISNKYHLKIGNVICGCGSDELISLLCRCYAGPGDQIVYSAHGFAMYSIYGKSVGAEVVAAQETELTTNVDNMLAAVNDKTKLVFVAN